MDLNKFSFSLKHPSFELRFCRSDSDTLPPKRFKKVGLDPNRGLFEEPLKGLTEDDINSLNSTHFYLVLKAGAMNHCFGLFLNAYSADGKLKDSMDFSYIFTDQISPILTDATSEQQEAKDISSAVEDLGLKGDVNDSAENDNTGT